MYTSILVVTTATTPQIEAATVKIIKEGGVKVIIAGAAVKIPPRGEAGRHMRSTVLAVSSRVPARKSAMESFTD